MGASYRCRVCGGSRYEVKVSEVRDWEYGVPGEFSFVECKDCEQVQLHPFPSVEDLIQAYPAHYPAFVPQQDSGAVYNFLYSLHQKAFSLKRLRSWIDASTRVLDVGCGNGRVLASYRDQGVARIQGIDFSPEVARILKGQDIPVFTGLFLDFDDTPDSWDIVIMNNYIEHVLDPVAELSKARRILRPGGVIYGTLPNFDGLDRAWFGKYWGGGHVPRHTFQYTPASLSKLLNKAEYAKVEIVQDVNPCHIAVSLQNWQQRNAPDLANNPRLKNGRTPLYSATMLATLPLNAVFKAAGRSGVMTFYAFK
jgi:SAM-dependent methyltransferase